MAAAPDSRLNSQSTVIRFGLFEFDTDAKELRKQGMRVRLQAQPMQMLFALTERPGQIVARDELRRKLWSDDTFVDFERSLNSAANRLRLVLGDSAENPRFIETVPGIGYRFIAPVIPNTSAIPATEVPTRGGWLLPAVAAALTASIITWAVMRPAPTSSARYRTITFARGQVTGAAFIGESDIIYSARWGEAPLRLFLTTFRSPESRPLGLERMTLATVSSTSELALFQGGLTSNIAGSTLYRVPVNGGAPAKVDDHIMSADWSADGKSFAIVRAIQGSNQIEYPVGQVLHKTAGWLTDVRVSPDGSAVAFIDHLARHDDAGDVRVWWAGKVKVVSANAARDGGFDDGRGGWGLDAGALYRSVHFSISGRAPFSSQARARRHAPHKLHLHCVRRHPVKFLGAYSYLLALRAEKRLEVMRARASIRLLFQPSSSDTPECAGVVSCSGGHI
jgi:DNA-binding winged helix-turn-helix (wHTH) protein